MASNAALSTTNDLSIAAADWAAELLDKGYCIIPNVLPVAKVQAFHNDIKDRFQRSPFCEGEFYGNRTKRFGGVLKRSEHAKDMVQHPLILEIVNKILSPFCDRIQLNLTQAIEIHAGQIPQVPHRDQDMWGGPKGEIEYLVNVMWPFTHYTSENGATVVWPNSHRRQEDLLIDPSEAITAEMPPGSVLLFLGSTLHGGGANHTLRPRAGMIVSYCLGWLKPYENQWLVYPPEVAKKFSPELAALVGYQQHRPNLGNYEGQCPSVLLKDELPEFMSALDELRPDQEQLIAKYRELGTGLLDENGVFRLPTP